MADEYVSREAALRECQFDTDGYVTQGIKAIPAADVAPVRHGKWIDKCVRDWRCSECGGEIDKVRHVDGYCYDNLPRYCPDCGALMDKDGDA